MALNRREFLGAVLGSSMLHAVAPIPRVNGADSFFGGSEATKKGFSILQGMTDESTSQFTLVLPKGAYSIEATGGSNSLNLNTRVVDRPFSDFVVHKVSVSGLQLGVAYNLRVLDSTGAVADERIFRALDLSERKVKLAFVSCQLDLFHHDDIWAQVEKQKADLVFFTGDNVYCDRTSLIHKAPADAKQLWERYVLTRNRVAFYYQKELTPVLAIWDDHDFGTDNGDRTFAYAADSAIVFDTFFAQDARPALSVGPGIARRLSAFGGEMFLLDDRTWRDAKGTANGKMFGAAQDAWLAGGLNDSPAFIISGSVFFGAYSSGESYEGPFPADFKEFRARIQAAPCVCAFISGDVHYSEVMDIEAAQVGYPTVEIVSSGIHSYTFPGHENRFTNPRRRAGCAFGAHNFVMFNGGFAQKQIRGEVSSYSAGKAEFSTQLLIQR